MTASTQKRRLVHLDAGSEADPIAQLHGILRAVHVMKMYATANGLAIPEGARQTIANLTEVESEVAAAVEAAGQGAARSFDPKWKRAMAQALEVHASLSKVVEPATPDSILYTQPPTGLSDLRRRQGILFWLMVLASIAIVGFIGTLIGKSMAAERWGAPARLLASLGAFAERLEALEVLPRDTSQTRPDIAAVITDLERRSAELAREAAQWSALAGPWPDEVIVGALTQINDQPTGAPAAIARIRDAVAGFESRAAAIQTRPAWPGIVLDQLNNLFAAMLGAAFYTLYTANRYIVLRTFDRAYTTHYIVRFVLGIVAGVILANFGDYVLSEKAPGAGEVAETLTQTLLALIGGYSADAVNAIFTRVAETLTTLVRGGPSQAARDEAEAEVKRAQAASKAEVTERKGAELARLQRVYAQAVSSKAPDEVVAAIKEQMEALGKEP